ncbi:hypothetical protein [Blastococcus sp. PRF04-17]|uniref:hypothetical protein n=1 Tax=Blastococcus sp. PRF04-17 TaxID=2933797 RepID=UPI001FF14F05|nr:hypothetical protein [Blastococcus sp. PRF04-17]UOY01606.1 hypothetical protein MVA48_22245 [Blastococcus sp. PRF04-17]
MRIVLVFLVVTGAALIAAGAVRPELFVLSLLGLLISTGAAAVALATLRPPGARPRF